MAHTSGEDLVVLTITDPSTTKEKVDLKEISISTSDIRSWNVPQILESDVVEVLMDRNRLIEQSSYFRGLLGGSFSESGLNRVLVEWNLEAFVGILLYVHGCFPGVASENFVSLMEGALVFGVESLLMECEAWFHNIASTRSPSSLDISLETIFEIWKFCSKCGIILLPDLCESFLARNFAWAVSCRSFVDVPYELLVSCLDHPDLTVDSEKQLCEALLVWLSINSGSLGFSSTNSANTANNYPDLLRKVRIVLLPLEFASGQRKHITPFGNAIVRAVRDMTEDYPSSLLKAIGVDNMENFTIRLTKYSQKIILSGCAHFTVVFLFLAVFPHDLDDTLKKRMIHTLTELDPLSGNHNRILEKSFNTLTFESVQDVDISRCPRIHFLAAIKWLYMAFPSLRILKASHCSQFKLEHIYYLIQVCSRIEEIDLTVDITPVIPTRVSVLSTCTERYQEQNVSNAMRDTLRSPMFSKISKLTLEGRHEINDLELLRITSLSDSLCYLNITGCILVTDTGISELISKCLNIHSLILSYTSFGRDSVMALCSNNHVLPADSLGVDYNHEHPCTMAFRLQQLHIDGCTGVDQNSMLLLLNHTYMLKTLVLRETALVGDALNSVRGSSLEMLDISETMVSAQALVNVVGRNPFMRILKATGCRKLHQHDFSNSTYSELSGLELLPYALGNKCILEEIAFGWGYPSLSLEQLEPTIGKLRVITLGLGASPSRCALCLLPKICPLLESVTLKFQVISDDIVKTILESLKYLRILELRCCLGSLTSFSFWTSMPNLRALKLDWIARFMTNNDLTILTQCCSNLVELSLSGCTLLDSDSQEIIASGWPGLTCIHLEDCGKVTSDGVSSLFSCKAVEDLLLRHNGRGIGRNFIFDAASKLPLLRKVALDLCDACEGGFDSPNHANRFYLSTARISCCKSQRCGFDLKPVHKETIVLEWTCEELRTTKVKERL